MGKALSFNMLQKYMDSPDYIKMTEYKEVLDVGDLPEFKGTTSMFNPYTIFNMSAVMQGASTNTDYDVTLHYDLTKLQQQNNIDPNALALLQGDSNGIAMLGNMVNSMRGITGSNDIGRNDYEYGDSYKSSSLYSQGHMRAPTAAQLVKLSSDMDKQMFGPVPYSWSDFIYCKWYGLIPNNHLVTLRRYPFPTYDNVNTPSGTPALPIAQAVTWFGEDTGNKLNDIMKITYGVNWKEIEAQVQEVDGNERMLGVGAESLAGRKFVSYGGAALTMARGSYNLWSGRAEKDVEWAKKSYTSQGAFWNRLYGAVNVVHKSHMRDRGLHYQHDIKLKFTYSLLSYKGINPRIAMMDLITNFLILTYTNAKFWGGAVRYFPNAQFRVGFLGNQNLFYAGDMKGYGKSLVGEIQTLISGLADTLTKMMSGDISSAIKNAGQALGQLGLDKLASQSRPHLLSIRNMLSGDPVGEYHLTIGNPFNPIAVIGNLIVTKTEMELGEILGADDFPSEVTFTVYLKPGKPRDKGDMESMFNLGAGRMSYMPKSNFEEFAEFLHPSGKDDNTFGKDGSTAEKVHEKFEQWASKWTSKTGKGFDVNRDANLAIWTAQQRIKNEWGSDFAGSPNFLFLYNATSGQF